MPGPKYVKDFEFPSSFGFSNSSTDRSTVPVRPHERARPQRYARGGKVRKDEGGLVEKVKKFFGSDDKDPGKQVAQAPPTPTPPPPRGDTVRVTPEGSTADTLKNQRERQMKELGLKRGGKVKHQAKTKVFHGASFPSEGFEGNTDLPVASPQDSDNVTAPMAKRGGAIRKAKGGKWIAGAIKHPGAFKAKAKKAGMSTSAFASKVTKPGSKASATTKRQGNLARTLASVRPHAMGGPIRYREGGSVKVNMRNVAKQEVARHVAAPAPKGHKGLRNC